MPFLVYSDFVRQINELHEVCDYMVVDLSEFMETQGVQMLYRDSKSLVKLLSAVSKEKNKLVGKKAALEFEKFQNDIVDPQCAVNRVFQSSAVISSNKPVELYLKIQSTKNNLKIASEAKRQNFQGLILCSENTDLEADLNEVRTLKKLGMKLVYANDLTVKDKESYERAREAGADEVQLRSMLLTEGPYMIKKFM